MVFIFTFLVLFSGMTAGFFIGRQKPPGQNDEMVVDRETLNYLVDRDNELWELEKAARNKVRYISPDLIRPNQHDITNIDRNLN